MSAFPTVGSFPLTGVTRLPRATVAFPGEHWTNRIAHGAVEVGTAVLSESYGGKLAVATAPDSAATNVGRMGIALRPIDVPDGATDSQYTTSLGPNQIRNLPMADGDYVHVYYSGVFHVTLAVPRAWVPGELVKWNATGARPTGISGAGSWDVTTTLAIALFEVQEFRPFSSDGHEGLLTIRSLRGQF